MQNLFRDHYGHTFELDLNKVQIAGTNRLSRLLLFFSFLFGLMFFALGAYFINIANVSEHADFESTISQSAIAVHTSVPPHIFGSGLIVLGIAIVLVCIFFLGRYKTISIANGIISVTDHPFIGKPHSFSAPIEEYSGVRLRLKFCQYDLFSRNKYIVELYHPQADKLVPLYISTNPKNIRAIWRKYAEYFNLSPIYISDKGMVSLSMRDLNRPYVEVVKDWHLSQNFLANKTHSTDFICKKKNEKKMLKTAHTIYDLYSTLNIAVIASFSFLFMYTVFSYHALSRNLPHGVILSFCIFLLTCMIYAYLTLTVRDIVLINNQKLIIFRKVLGITFQDDSVDFSSLKGLDIFYTPTTGRYCLNVITNRKVIKIFNKLSADDLRWIKCFIISEIIQG